MASDIECFGNQRTLEGDILGITGAEFFVNTPTDGNVIHDAMIAARQTRSIERGARKIAGPRTDVANDEVASTADTKLMFVHACAFARRSLTGHRDVGPGLIDDEVALDSNQSRHVEDDGTRTIVSFNRIAETARTAVVGIIHFHHHAAATAARKPSVTFRTRKC